MALGKQTDKISHVRNTLRIGPGYYATTWLNDLNKTKGDSDDFIGSIIQYM